MSTAASVLESETQVRMDPMQMRKAGSIIQNMQAEGHTDEEINDVCRALFCDQSEADMKLAWKIFDKHGKGQVDATEFRKSLRLMGDDVSEEHLDRLFK